MESNCSIHFIFLVYHQRVERIHIVSIKFTKSSTTCKCLAGVHNHLSHSFSIIRCCGVVYGHACTPTHIKRAHATMQISRLPPWTVTALRNSIPSYPTCLLIKHHLLLPTYHLNICLLLIFAASRLRASPTTFFFCISVNRYPTGTDVHFSGARNDLEIQGSVG